MSGFFNSEKLKAMADQARAGASRLSTQVQAQMQGPSRRTLTAGERSGSAVHLSHRVAQPYDRQETMRHQRCRRCSYLQVMAKGPRCRRLARCPAPRAAA